jgi:hypothetical protein
MSIEQTLPSIPTELAERADELREFVQQFLPYFNEHGVVKETVPDVLSEAVREFRKKFKLAILIPEIKSLNELANRLDGKPAELTFNNEDVTRILVYLRSLKDGYSAIDPGHAAALQKVISILEAVQNILAEKPAALGWRQE